MPSLNLCQFMGNLTRDPELRRLDTGTSVCEFGLAVNRTWKDKNDQKKEEVMFLDCVAWGRRGEVIDEYFKKGNPIYVQGHLRLESWEDKDTGGKRYKHKLTIDQFQFLQSKKDGGGGGRSRDEAPSGAPSEERGDGPGPPSSDFGVDDEDVPF